MYKLIIPQWEAVIPMDWPLEVKRLHVAEEDFQLVSGTRIVLKEGDLLRGGPQEILDAMVEHNYVRLEDSDGDSI